MAWLHYVTVQYYSQYHRHGTGVLWPIQPNLKADYQILIPVGTHIHNHIRGDIQIPSNDIVILHSVVHQAMAILSLAQFPAKCWALALLSKLREVIAKVKEKQSRSEVFHIPLRPCPRRETASTVHRYDVTTVLWPYRLVFTSSHIH
ncbi:hypothetical protein A0H81_14911 [Grifola frondosa]|uniref:Uncharacterized protein n=1 Tax=Grifola frondosa TaxID=5627 RepID=A0A1C7LQQ7_GRIFR|nr:hypothetical protein A0H81_14911 [Grifola frondosa]